MIRFKEKVFGLLGDMGKGAVIGAGVGAGMTRFYLGGNKKFINLSNRLTKVADFKDKAAKKLELSQIEVANKKQHDTTKPRKVELTPQVGAITGAIIGATLGAIASGIKAASNFINRKRTVDNRLMGKVVKGLESRGHKEGMSFTRDPRKADLLKTKVSIVIYKYSDELRIVVNSVNDNKLDRISEEMTKRLAASRKAVFSEEISGKYKDLKITAISDPSTDAEVISWVASTFIENGYPVYLVEVG